MPTEPTITAPGIYDLAPADYHALPHLSRSTIHTMLTRSPAHANMEGGDKATDPMKLGTVAHALFLGKGARYAVLPEDVSPKDDYTTKVAQVWRDAHSDAGITPIKRKEFDIAQAMADRCREQICHHEIGDILEAPGVSEPTVIWKEQGVTCRCMIDRLPEDIHAIYDYKTKADASDEAFRKSAWRDGDYLQANFYARGVAAVTGRDPIEIRMRFIVQESVEPYLVNVIEVSGEGLFMAEEKIEKALRIWKRCTATGKWPGYSNKVHEVDPPGYAINEWERQKSIDELEPAA